MNEHLTHKAIYQIRIIRFQKVSNNHGTNILLPKKHFFSLSSHEIVILISAVKLNVNKIIQIEYLRFKL